MNNEIGKVVKIIDEYTLVIDAGEQRVKKGEIIQVYRRGDEIKNPETAESLGTLEIPVGPELEIISVMRKMSLARVAEFYTDPVMLRINPLFYTGSRMKLPDSIKVGDLVKEIK